MHFNCLEKYCLVPVRSTYYVEAESFMLTGAIIRDDVIKWKNFTNQMFDQNAIKT